MEQVFFLLVVLAGVTHAAETKCTTTQNTSVCSVTLGGSVNIQVMTNASGHQLWCKKQLPTGSMKVFSLKKEKVTIEEAFRNRVKFFINNGTLEMTNVQRNDSGQYSIEVYDLHGVLVTNNKVKLDVQDGSLRSRSSVQENILPTWILVCLALGVDTLLYLLEGEAP